jgi:translation initiation factor IF-3
LTVQERKLKTIQLGYNIAQGDLDTKTKHAREFLDKGHRVKIEMRMKGRQNAHPDIALEKMKGVVESLMEPRIVVEKKPTLDGKTVIAQLIAKLKM